MQNNTKLLSNRNILFIIIVSIFTIVLAVLALDATVHRMVMQDRMNQVIEPIQLQLKKNQLLSKLKLEAIEEQYDVSILWFQREQSLTNQLPELSYDSSNLNENIKKLISEQVHEVNSKPKISLRSSHYLATIPLTEASIANWVVVVMPAISLVDNNLQILSVILAVIIILLVIVISLFWRYYFIPLRKLNVVLHKLLNKDYQLQFPLIQNGHNGIVGEMTQSLQQLSSNLIKQENALSTTVHQRSVLINHLILGIVVVDSEGKIVLTNPAANAMLDIVDRNIGEHYTSVIKSYPILSMIDRVRQNHLAQREEVELWVPHTQIVDVNIVPYGQGNINDEILILLYDLTAIRRLEEVRSEFVANASHELRTPVTAIKGFAETLQNGAMENPTIAMKFINIIADESHRLEHIIEDILSLSRIEKQQLAINVTSFDLVAKIRSMSHLFAERLEQKNMQLVLPNSGPIMIETDEQRIENIVTNLIDNAINYSEDNKKIMVRAEESSRMVRLSIIDQGVGIPPEEQERIFERFYRVDKARSRQTGGTGLGLSIVRHLVKTMNGTISVESKVGQGSSFTVKLPKYWGKRNLEGKN
ncbi:ATP-binding protein [Globicatella sulfidifaciens]|uniref:two-component system histidine kinase PnpS n=1 Tax=Globicatella sulfidifaciens TaxID=136093 RepID=UPI00288C7351|nr:ATP-binding protein [Globicatella sulfidifaciens]MDT2768577.1 ATP-binding protein [Globicatella sulfidifaciens]